jgi:hypothetical protein
LRGGLTDEEYRWKTIRRWGKALMVGKRVQFDDETWQAIEAVADDTGKAFQELADEAFADLLKKHKQPGRAESCTQGERWGPESAPQALNRA